MVLSCPHCSRTLEISGEPPTFCAYCGQRLREGLASAPTVLLDTPPGGEDGRPLNDSETVAYVSKRFAAPAELSRVAGYKLLRALGSGGMGTVFEAIDERTERHVALKLIAPEFVRSRDAVERFRQEGKLASTIEHPRCVFVLAADEYEGRPYIVMELMPGATLQSDVEAKGPLPVEEAVTKILDVIEGLRQAHRMGVVHRDVKPSNCFLDADGRVKVGDFGLSKSLAEDVHLTRTGAFVGTPLYASPEQIKGEAVDERTDVYSVAATLYFLLAGRPPFKEADATATIARIVTEAPPSLRSLRPELPPALDAAVLRGLERDRDRRWRDLDQLRAALTPFLPGRLSRAGIGLRVGAFLIDLTLFLLAYALVFGAVAGARRFRFAFAYFDRNSDWIGVVANVVMVLYYGVMEGVWGASVGKWLSELKVCRADNGLRPGLGRGLLRALVFYIMIGLADDILGFLPGQPNGEMAGPMATIRQFLMFGTTTIGIHLAGVLILVSTMRARSGYRGPHEWLSGTRVVSAAPGARRRLPEPRRVRIDPTPSTERPLGMGERLGPFTLCGVLRWEHDRKILLAQDASLERTVWIVLRPRDAEPPSATRQNLARAARPRWLTGGTHERWRWDAYLAPAGCSLADLAGGRGLSWAEVRPILEDLVEELDLASRDGTLPEVLTVEEVWVQPDGRVLLVDPLAPTPDQAPACDHSRCIFDLTVRAAALALEGYRKRDGGPLRAIRAPVPRHVAEIFDRLLGDGPPFAGASELLSALHAARPLPTEVSRARRSAHLILQSALLLPGLIMMFWVAYSWQGSFYDRVPHRVRVVIELVPLFWPIAWIGWAVLTRGGLTMRLAGMTLVRRNNQLAGRLRCGVRAALVWLPIALLLAASMLAPSLAPHFPLLGMLLWSTALGLVLLGPMLALVNPARGLHDRLLGTALVPA